MSGILNCMALFIRQSEDRSKLQERLAAELSEKAKARALENERPDGVDNSRYLEGTKQTTSLAWVWIAIIIFIALAIIFFMLHLNN